MAKTRKPRRAAPRPRRAASRKARGESARLPRVSKSEAPFVFRGTVLHRGVATFADVPVNKDTVVVRVDQILQAPDILHDFAGQPITVQLAAKQKVAEGDEHVFHTHGWIYGAGLAVVADDLSSASVASRVNAALQSRVTQSLRSRASQAELVVSGEVKEIRQAARPAHAPISEHDPEWQEAVVRVGHVAKGARSKSTREVVVRFAASRDVKWARAPKFNVGQQGVWMLGHKAKKEAAAMRLFAAAPKTQYVVVDPEDFHPQDQAARVLSQIE